MRKTVIRAFLISCLCAVLLSTASAASPEAPGDPVIISDREGLEAIAANPSGHFVLGADIDMSGTAWTPIPFSGYLDGAGYSLLNLTVRDCDPVTAISVDGNAKQYDTVFAALFSRATGAVIKNLSLIGVDVAVTSGENAFAAGLVGYAEDVSISQCTVTGQVYLEASNTMCGVSGVVGFGYGKISDSSARVTLTLVDTNQTDKSEEFMGGMLGTGYVDVSGSDVWVRAFTSVYGYVHNGGIIGMYYVHTSDTGHQGYVRDCVVDAEIYFFEANSDRRAYCDPYVGERLNYALQISNCTAHNFVNGETLDYSKTLLPDMCAMPNYVPQVTPPDCAHFGFTTHTCRACGYQYDSDYTLAQHVPGDWETGGEKPGVRRLECAVCGVLLDEEQLSPSAPPSIEPIASGFEAAPSAAPSKTPETEKTPRPGAWLIWASAAAVVVLLALVLRPRKRGKHERVRHRGPR